jgi:hypothetical protein
MCWPPRSWLDTSPTQTPNVEGLHDDGTVRWKLDPYIAAWQLMDGDVCASSTPIPAGDSFVHMRLVATNEPATAGRQQSSHQHRFLQIARYPEGGTLALVGRCGMARGASRRSTQRDRGAHSPTNRWGRVTMSPRKQRAPYSGPSTALGRTVGVRLGGCSAGSQPVGCTMNQSKIAAQMLHGCCAKTCDLRICWRD